MVHVSFFVLAAFLVQGGSNRWINFSAALRLNGCLRDFVDVIFSMGGPNEKVP